MCPDHNQPVDASVVPRFGDIPTFMRLPHTRRADGLDIALVGVPWDGGTTNRAGARHGPREIRNQSSLMRKVHHVSRIAPYDLAQVADLGDCPVNPIDLMDSLARIERFYRTIHQAGALPLSAGGDHLITLPIMRAIARDRPVGAFDAQRPTTVTSATTVHPRNTLQASRRGRVFSPSAPPFRSDTRVDLRRR